MLPAVIQAFPVIPGLAPALAVRWTVAVITEAGKS